MGAPAPATAHRGRSPRRPRRTLRPRARAAPHRTAPDLAGSSKDPHLTSNPEDQRTGATRLPTRGDSTSPSSGTRDVSCPVGSVVVVTVDEGMVIVNGLLLTQQHSAGVGAGHQVPGRPVGARHLDVPHHGAAFVLQLRGRTGAVGPGRTCVPFAPG